MNPSSTPMSDDFEIREPAAKHPSPSEGLKRFTVSESDEQSDELDNLLNRYRDALVSDYGDAWQQEERVADAIAALQAYIAHHTKEAERRARIDELTSIPLEPNGLQGYIEYRLAELAATEQKRGGDGN